LTSRREKKIQQRETLILEAAANLVERVGYANLNIEMIIDEVGIARATLYQHFRNKEDIILHALLRGMEKLEQQVLNATGTAIERLAAIFRYMLKGERLEDSLTGVLTNDELRNLFFSHEEVNKCYVRTFHLFDELLNQAKQEGAIAADLSNEMLLGMMFGLCKIASYHTSPLPPEQLEKMIGQTVRIFLRGIQP
jgi:AcrR family transcriptional regulator